MINDISGEISKIQIGDEYLPGYEVWGGSCVKNLWTELPERQGASAVNIDSRSADMEREQACYEYVREETDNIIKGEWKPEIEKRGIGFVGGRYDDGGPYGRTRVLFRKKVNLQ